MAKRKIHWVIPVANELGYFPTAKQATDINCRAAHLYAVHFKGNMPKEIDEKVFNATLETAMEDVMSKNAKVAG